MVLRESEGASMNKCEKCGMERLFIEGEHLCPQCDVSKITYYARQYADVQDRKIRESEKANT